MFEFDYEKCIKYKEKFRQNGVINVIWRNKFAPSNIIGNCSNLYRKLQPTDYFDFYEKYITYAEKNQNIKINERGLTYNELIQLAKDYRELHYKEHNTCYELEEYFYEALAHIIIETFDGQKQERDFRKYLENKNYICEVVDGSFDAKYGVDIKVTNKKNYGIQIKPLSFFLSTRRDVVYDQKNLCYKYEKLLRDYNMKTYYAIYVKNKESNSIKWLKNNNGFRFKIEDLFEYDPKRINQTMKVKNFKYELSDLI